MISSGWRNTSVVDGAYWISCISSFWNTTLPGEVATFWPTLNAFSSVMLMWPRSMSPSRLDRPLTRFWPPLARVSRSTCGLVAAKLDGLSASTYWRVKNATLRCASGVSPSTSPTASWMCLPAIR